MTFWGPGICGNPVVLGPGQDSIGAGRLAGRGLKSARSVDSTWKADAEQAALTLASWRFKLRP